MRESELDLSRRINGLIKEDCEETLGLYIEHAWHVLEPGRPYMKNWSTDATCDHLEAVTKGQIQRLLINVPPGTMKSLTTEVFWPTWEWGPYRRPDLRYVSFSYSADLTTRDNRKARTLIGSSWYQSLWGDRFKVSSDQDAKMKFENDHQGFKLATSVGGLGTGERGDRVIVDDPHNVRDGESFTKRQSTLLWFTETLPTRVNDPKTTPIVVIMQRVHDQDVSGLILAQELGYEHLMLPMEFEPERACYSKVRPSYSDVSPCRVSYDPDTRSWKPDAAGNEMRYLSDIRTEDNQLLWPERFDRETVERDKKVMGQYAVAGQFQQRPTPRGGGMFKREWLPIIECIPSDVKIVKRCRGWDLAGSKEKQSPYTAGVRISRGNDGIFYIENSDRFKGTPGEVEKKLKSVARDDGKRCPISIPQDPGQAGKAQVRYLSRILAGYIIHFSPETGSKEDRAGALASQAEAGNVRVIAGDWNKAFIDEACMFPMGTFKDQIDAASRAFHRLVGRRTMSFGAPEAMETSE